MSWSLNYQAPNTEIWQGRNDAPERSTFFQVIKPLDLTQPFELPEITPAFVLLGFCCDEGVRRNLGRKGAVEGPAAIRQTLGKLPIHKKHLTIYDGGDIICKGEELETAQAALSEAVATLLKKGFTPILLGGGHEIAWGHYQGIVAAYPTDVLGIVNFDAHFDMRPLIDGKQGSSGTSFLQIAKACETADIRFDYNCIGIQRIANTKPLFDTAKSYHTQILYAEDIHQGNKARCMDFINHVIFYNKIIYLSMCMDVFAAAFAPGVSAPQAMGVTPWQMMPLIKKLASSGKIISYDIAELAPVYDLDGRTARLAASFIYEIIHYHHNHL